MEQFLLGTISMGFAVAALLFLRFWRSSHDRLFLFFAASFAIESVNRAVFAWLGGQPPRSTSSATCSRRAWAWTRPGNLAGSQSVPLGVRHGSWAHASLASTGRPGGPGPSAR